MTSAGLPLVQCLDILSAQTENKKLSSAVKQISTDIQGGSTLAEALQKHPSIFNSLYCNMVAAGEASGNLDVVLSRLADYQEKAESLRRKIKGAMTYPIIVLIAAILATIVMFTFVVPTFTQMFADMGGTLPLPTRIVMNISDFLVQYYYMIIFGSVIIGTAFYYYNKSPQGRMKIDSLKLKLPVFGDLERKSSISRFSQTLSTLLNSGVSGGQTIAEPLKETGVFPPMVIHMIAVGEKTGDLAEMLKKVADFYQEEVDAAIDALTSIIDPVMILGVGLIIGGTLIAMYLPMFDLVGTIKA
jgi:type IV pilus assembly protein PilC